MSKQMRQSVDKVYSKPIIFQKGQEIAAEEGQINGKEIWVNTQELRIKQNSVGIAEDSQQNLNRTNMKEQQSFTIKLDELSRLTQVFHNHQGTCGERLGIWGKGHFLTRRHPKLSENETIIVMIGGREYKSKPYSSWLLFGSITMIPLQKEPEEQLDIVDVSKLEDHHNIYLFSMQDGKTVNFPLKLQINQEGHKYIRSENDTTGQISKLHNGCPVLTVYNNKPALVCLKDYMKSGQISDCWTFKLNLDKDKMEFLIKAKAEIAQAAQLQLLVNNLAKPGSEIDISKQRQSDYSVYFCRNSSIQESPPQQIYQILDYGQKKELKELKALRQQQKRRLEQLKLLRLQLQSKEQALIQKIQHVCNINKKYYHVQIQYLLQCQDEKETQQSKKTCSNSGQFLLDVDEKYKGHYDIACAQKKFLNTKCMKFLNRHCLNLFVDRNYQNLKMIASWPENHHLLTASQLDYRINNGSPQFSYQTVKCECGCSNKDNINKNKEERSRLHKKGMTKLALEKPLVLIAAALDAVICLQKHYILHNDIQLHNFIFYQQDFLLGDFDMSCFVKDACMIKFSDKEQIQLNLVNIALIDMCKLILKRYEQNNEEADSINLFFRDMNEKLQPKETSYDTLQRLNESITEGHQNQIMLKIIQELIKAKSNCKANEQHLKQIKQMLKNRESNESILHFTREKIQGSSLQSLIPSS